METITFTPELLAKLKREYKIKYDVVKKEYVKI
jgi:hypothetical protein